MQVSKLFSILLVFLALLALALFLFFVFRKSDAKKETEETKTEETTSSTTTQPVLAGNVLNVVTHLSDDRVNLLTAGLGDSYMLDARSKANSYTFNGVTVSVVSGEVSNLPGYSKYTHTLPKAYKGSKLVFDADASHEFFEHPVTKLTAYFWFNSLLFLTFTTQSEGETPELRYYHFSAHVSENTLKWDRFDRDPRTELDPSVLLSKLDDVNLASGNVVALNLDEYLEGATGTYDTTLSSVTSKISLAKRSSSSTGFVRVTHKLVHEVENGHSRPFKLKRLRVSGTELSDLALTNKPLVSLSVYWWYNMPLLAELDLHGGTREHLTYNVDTNNWESENVEKLRSKLFLLKNKLGEPVTLDLSKSGDHDETYTTNGVLVRVSPGATPLREVKKFTHRFTTGNAHFVGSFLNAGTAQLGLPVMRLVEVSVYYVKGVPMLVKLNLATAGSLTSKFRYYSSNGYGVWKAVELTTEMSTTEALLNRLNEENERLLQENDKYVLDAMMLANYMSSGRVVEVSKQPMSEMPGYFVYKHQAFNGAPFKLEKFTVGGKDVAPSVATVEGVEYANMYLFLNTPLLLHMHVSPGSGADAFYSFNATTSEWSRAETDLSSVTALKEHLSRLRGTMSSVTLNLGNSEGEYKSGIVTVQVMEATPYENDPPTSFTKRVHVLTPAFPVDAFKHFDFDLVLATKKEGSAYETPSTDPMVPKNFVVSKAELYFFGDVPLYLIVHGTHGTPYRFSNVFKGTLWRQDTTHTVMGLADLLKALSVDLRAVAKFDVCKDAPADTVVTYQLKHLGSNETTNVTVTKTEAADGVTLLTHKMPDSVTLKFTTLTCGEHALTGLSMEEVSKVFLYRRYKAPLFLKMNSNPRFFALSGDGGLTRYVPPAGVTDLTDEQVRAKVSELSTKVGKVFDLDLMSKADYTLHNTQFTVTETTVAGFKRRLHTLKTTGTKALPFTVRSLVHGTKDAVVYPTGLKVSWVAVFFKNDEPFYLQVKETSLPLVTEAPPPASQVVPAPASQVVPAPASLPAAPPTAVFIHPDLYPHLVFIHSFLLELQVHSDQQDRKDPQLYPEVYPNLHLLDQQAQVVGGPSRGPVPLAGRELEFEDGFDAPADTGKHHHFVNDSGLWLSDGVYEHFDDEDMEEKLDVIKDGLGNEFSLDLSENVDNPLFDVDMADFALVPGFTKHTYNPKRLEYPLLLKDLKVGETELNLPFADRHLKRFSAYSFRKNFLFFHSVSHDDKDEFFVTNFSGSFEKVAFDVFNQDVLKKKLEALKKRLGNLVSLDIANKAPYNYHSYVVNVVKQREDLEHFDKYMHDLTDNGVSVPLKLVSVRNNGHVTNVPSLEDLVYFVYVYMSVSDSEPLLLELHTSSPERSNYDYYYFGNVLGNWELLENPSLGQLDKGKLKESLELYRTKMSKTYRVDLSRKFSYRPENALNTDYELSAMVEEDPRETVGFSMYSHTFTLNPVAGATVRAETAPTASGLGGATAAAESPSPPAEANTGVDGARQAAEGTGAGTEAGRLATSEAVSSGAGLSRVPNSVVPSAQNSENSATEASGGHPRTTTLTTYQTLKANALRGVNTMAGTLPVGSRFMLGGEVLRGLGVDTLLKANVYWYHDKSPGLVHVNNGVDNKYYVKKGRTFVMSRKETLPLTRSEVVALLNEARENLLEPVDVDMDKSSDFDTHVKYVSNGMTLKVVPSYSLKEGFKGFTHFSATHYERAFKVKSMSLWGDVVLTTLPKGHVKSATVFTDSHLLPLAVELEWTVLNNMSFVKKYNYYKNTGGEAWVAHPTRNTSERLVDDDLLAMLKAVKTALGERVVLSLDKRATYGTAPVVTVTLDPVPKPQEWKGFHRVTHTYTNAARMVMLKMGDRVLRTLHVATHVKAVDTYWFKNALLLVRVTVAGSVAGSAASPDTYKYFKNDEKDDLMEVDAPASVSAAGASAAATLNVTTPDPALEELAAKFRDSYQLDVAEKTLKNAVDSVTLLPALQVVDTSVPPGYARYNLYILDRQGGVQLGKMLYHGKDFSTDNLSMPAERVHSVYAFSPVGHFSPFFMELQSRTPDGPVMHYYHLNQHGDWLKLETGGKRLTHAEQYGKLSLLSTKFGNVTVVDLSKTEGSYYGLNKMDVTRYEFPGVQGFNKYLHRAHDVSPFTVSKFVNKGVVMSNLPVLKVLHVAVYTTRDNRPMLLELKVGGRYRFFSSNANGEWNEERLPSGDLRAALDAVYDEHNEVARLTGDMVTLRLHTGFVREYVLTEGTVADHEGSVAVVEDEPEPEPAPQAQRLLPEAPETADPTVQEPAGGAGAAARAPPAPLPTVKRSHVLNPETYVESDRLAYSYASHGKSVHVSRRDEMYRGFNVTVHRLANSAPFTLRRVVFMGRAFDLSVGAEKFLSSTLFSSMNKPLVLKLVTLAGAEKLFSFDFATQNWNAFEAQDLELTLDTLNYKENKMLVLDLAKETEYTVSSNAMAVSKTTFATSFKKVATKLKSAVEEEKVRRAKRDKVKAKRETYKGELRAEMEKRKAVFDKKTAEAQRRKTLMETFRTTWKTLNPTQLEQFVQLEAKMKALEDLKVEVPALELKVDNARTTEAFADLSKLFEQKKKELEALTTEVDAARRTANYTSDTELESLDVPHAGELKTALEKADVAAKAFRNRLDVKGKVEPTAQKVKAFSNVLTESTHSDVKAKLVAAADKLDALKTPVNGRTVDLGSVLLYVDELKPLLVFDKKALNLPTMKSEKDKLEAAVAALDELRLYADLAKKLEEVVVPAEPELTALSNKPDEARSVLEKVNAALELANPFDKKLRLATELKKVDDNLKLADELGPLSQELKKALDGLSNVTDPHAAKVKALKDALPNFAKFGEVHALAKKYRDAFLSGTDLNSELTMSALDAGKLLFDTALGLMAELKTLPEESKTDQLKEVLKYVTEPKTGTTVPNPFTDLKAALLALKDELPELAADLRPKITALEQEVYKVKTLHSLADNLKKDLDAVSLDGVTGQETLVSNVTTLKTKLTETNLTSLKTAVDSSVKFKDDLNDAYDLTTNTVNELTPKLDTANTAFTEVKNALTAVPAVTPGDSEVLKKLKAALEKAAKLKEAENPFNTLKDKVTALSAPVTHALTTGVAYRFKQLAAASAKLTLELKTEADEALHMAEDVVKKMANGHKALQKLDETYVFAAKFTPVYEGLKDFDATTIDADKFKKLVDVVTNLKEALVNVAKLNEGYMALKLFKAQLVTENKLDEAVTAAAKFSELFGVSTQLSEQVAKVEALKSPEPTNFEPAKAPAEALKTHLEKMNLQPNVTTIKNVVAQTQTALNEVAAELLKLGLVVGKHKHKKDLVELAKAENSYNQAKARHDRYDVDPETLDSDDGTSLTNLMFVLGGLRYAGKNLSHAGLPLGTHVHTLNAFFAPNSDKPLMLQFKYKESEDEDEPVAQVLLRPPPADSLTDSQTLASAARPGTPGAPEPGTASQVRDLLSHGVNRTQEPMVTARAAVSIKCFTNTDYYNSNTIFNYINATNYNICTNFECFSCNKYINTSNYNYCFNYSHNGNYNRPGAPARQELSLPDVVREMKKFSYPGRFFVLDVDGTWKPFVPERRGALREKLEELRVKHALGVNLDVGVVPGARREMVHVLNGENMKVRRVLYNSGNSMNRGQLPGAGGAAGTPFVVNLNEYDRSVTFFPPLNFEWFVHHRPPKTLADRTSDPLPEFTMERVSLNGVTLPLTEEAADVLTNLNSVSVVVNEVGTPLLLFACRTTRHASVVQHSYKVLALKGEVYDVDETFGQHHNLLYKLEHTDYAWDSDPTFEAFNKLMTDRLAELNSRLEPFYVVDLGASSHYMRGRVVVNVDMAEAFGVRHVSYTPGLKALGQEEEMQSTVPAFVVQKVFLGDTVFKGLKLPFRDALHVTAFFAPVHYPLKADEVATTTEKFPVLLEFSYRNKFNRLEHFYYNYVGGDEFEFLTKTKLRLTASEVAEVVRLVTYRNLRAGKFSVASLNLDFAVKGTHLTSGHKVSVEKMVKGAPGSESQVVNSTVPNGFVVYKYTMAANDAGFTSTALSFANVWKFAPTAHNYKVFYAYVRETDEVPVLVASAYTEAASTVNKYVWVGYNGAAAAAVMTQAPPDPTSVNSVATVSQELARLTGTADFLVQPRGLLLSGVEPGTTVKLSPVGGVRGFPVAAATLSPGELPAADLAAGGPRPGTQPRLPTPGLGPQAARPEVSAGVLRPPVPRSDVGVGGVGARLPHMQPQPLVRQPAPGPHPPQPGHTQLGHGAVGGQDPSRLQPRSQPTP
ncbi:hypothetical protein MACJ_001538 [Theileria orientalis]|uniref:Uncharacterized protein n=1 Tax=Theileria orientalis TaxID=68886 RepID=A0A976MAC2_THEOR|nr:hypothetical protein MACJ_001538 [Theileria orientalis]